MKFLKNILNESNKNNKIAITLVGLVVLIAAIGITLAIISTGKPNDTSSRVDEPEYKTLPILVGSERYVSTCQVVTEEDVADIFADKNFSYEINETYLDTSRDENTIVITTCAYGSALSLTAYQTLEPINLKRDLFSITDDTYEERLSALKKYEVALKSNPSDSAQKILDKMKSSMGVLKSAKSKLDASKNAGEKAAYDAYDEIKAEDTEGYVVAKSDDYFYFAVSVKNINYEVNISDGSKDSISGKTAVEKLEKLNKLYDKIVARTNDDDLSQEPAAMVAGEKKITTIGDTALLEACSILSKDAFEEIIGSKANDTVTRYSINSRVATEDVSFISEFSLPSNKCTRGHLEPSETFASSKIEVELSQSPTEELALKFLSKEKETSPYFEYENLESDADEAFLVKRVDNDFTKFVFKSGPYAMVGYSTSSSPGSETKYMNKETTVKLINLLHLSIQSSSKQAKNN